MLAGLIASTAVADEKDSFIGLEVDAGDLFASSIAVDGETAVIGAYLGDPTDGPRIGDAYVFVRVGGVWVQQGHLTINATEDLMLFGFAVAVSGDTAVVSAPDEDGMVGADEGSVHVFVRSAGVWSFQQRLASHEPHEKQDFGNSVAIAGDWLAVGADGSNYNDTRSGSVYMYERVGGTWQFRQRLDASNGGAGDYFGDMVAMSGTRLAVGAHLSDELGTNVGAVYIFELVEGAWVEQVELLPSNPTGSDDFGAGLDLDGDRIAIGAPHQAGPAGNNQGAVYVFESIGGVWTETAHLRRTNGAAFEQHGLRVAIENDAVIAGSPYFNPGGITNAGGATLYQWNGASWAERTQPARAAPPGPTAYGFGAAFAGNEFLIAAPADDTAQGMNSGQVYVFDLPCPSDQDENGQVDGMDLAAMLAAWGETDTFADVNRDGVVDGADLAALLATWGTCP